MGSSVGSSEQRRIFLGASEKKNTEKNIESSENHGTEKNMESSHGGEKREGSGP